MMEVGEFRVDSSASNEVVGVLNWKISLIAGIADKYFLSIDIVDKSESLGALSFEVYLWIFHTKRGEFIFQVLVQNYPWNYSLALPCPGERVAAPSVHP